MHMQAAHAFGGTQKQAWLMQFGGAIQTGGSSYSRAIYNLVLMCYD